MGGVDAFAFFAEEAADEVVELGFEEGDLAFKEDVFRFEQGIFRVGGLDFKGQASDDLFGRFDVDGGSKKRAKC